MSGYCEVSFLDETAVFHKPTTVNTEQEDKIHGNRTVEQYPVMDKLTELSVEGGTGQQDVELKETAQFFFPSFDRIIESAQANPIASVSNTSHNIPNDNNSSPKKIQKEEKMMQMEELLLPQLSSSAKKKLDKLEPNSRSINDELKEQKKKQEESKRLFQSRSQPRLQKQDNTIGYVGRSLLDQNLESQEKTISMLPQNTTSASTSNCNNKTNNIAYKGRFSSNRPSLQSLSMLKEGSMSKQSQQTAQKLQFQHGNKIFIDEDKNARLNNFISSLNPTQNEVINLKTSLALAAVQQSKSKHHHNHRGLQEKQQQQGIQVKLTKESQLNVGKLTNLRLPEDNIYGSKEIISDSSKYQEINQLLQTQKVNSFRQQIVSPKNAPGGYDNQIPNMIGIAGNIDGRCIMNLSQKKSNIYIEQIEQVQKNLKDDLLLESLRRQQQLLQRIRQQQIRNFEGLHAANINSPQGQQEQQYFDGKMSSHLKTKKIAQTTQTNQTEYTLADSTDRNEKQLTLESFIPPQIRHVSSENIASFYSSGINQKGKSRNYNGLLDEKFKTRHFAAGKKSFQIEENKLIQDNDERKQIAMRKQFYSFHQNPLGQIQSIKSNFDSNPNFNNHNHHNLQEELANELERARKQIRQSISKGNIYKVAQQFYPGQQGFPQVSQKNSAYPYQTTSGNNNNNNNNEFTASKQNNYQWGFDAKQCQQYDDRIDSSREARTADTAQSTKLKTFLQRKPQENILNKIFSNQPDPLE